jgi:hypothetical protein
MSGKFRFEIPLQCKPVKSRPAPKRPQSIPSKLARKALSAHPEKSNRALAAEVGVSGMTVLRQRRSTRLYDLIEKTIGRDGKERPARRRDAKPIPKGDRFDWKERELILGQPGNTLEAVLARKARGGK